MSAKDKADHFQTAWMIASTCLYSTGHWIGGSVSLLISVIYCAVNRGWLDAE